MQRWQLAGWIESVEFAETLAELTTQPVTHHTLLGLRRRFERSQAELLYEIAQVRAVARRKFSRGSEMLMTRRGWEQSSGQVVGSWKARRFRQTSRVIDLCCGVGGDALALAGAVDEVAVVDRDPLMVAMARANCGVYDRRCAAGIVASCEELSLATNWVWHLDPDRRAEENRTVRLEKMAPRGAWIRELVRRCPTGALKLAPATEFPTDWASTAEATWISHHGECRQLVLWFGELAWHRARRVAVRLDAAGEVHEWIGSAGEAAEKPVRRTTHVGSLVLELDPALLAAGLASDFLRRHGCVGLTPGGGYATADELARSVAQWVQAYTVDTVLPLRLPAVEKWLRKSRLYLGEVKQRGTDVRPQEWLKRLGRRRLPGDARTLLAMRVDGRAIAVIGRRVVGSGGQHHVS